MPVTVTGFEPVDLLYGIYKTIKQLEEETCRVENGYSRVVSEKGNPKAWEAVQQFFKPYDSSWRGLGEIPGSGLILRPEYEHYNAEKRFIFTESAPIEKQICRAGKIMRGLMTPKHARLSESSVPPIIRRVLRWFLRRAYAQLIIAIIIKIDRYENDTMSSTT